jgi:hypothetical protein
MSSQEFWKILMVSISECQPEGLSKIGWLVAEEPSDCSTEPTSINTVSIRRGLLRRGLLDPRGAIYFADTHCG